MSGVLNIKDLETDELFKLLPWIVRVRDNGAVKLLMRALADQHNFFSGQARELMRLQDPWQAAKWSPTEFAESPTDWEEYSSLLRRKTLSQGQSAYLEELRRRLPNSIKAFKRETAFLGALAGNVGEEQLSDKLRMSVRALIASAISRHHIKGSHSSVRALGMVTGLFDLKVQELWSRFSIMEPSDPASTRNDNDFAYEPEEYPYRPISSIYDGVPGTQYPLPSASYDPNVLDDAGSDFTLALKWCSPDRLSPFWYNKSVNGRNPFGNFSTEVEHRLVSGSYHLSGGSDRTRASVAIATIGGPITTFEAISHGSWANSVVLDVLNNPNGTQDIELTGPRSKIKFKSSFFDLVIGVDLSLLPLLYPMIPVEETGAESYLDGLLGRTVPDFPVTSDYDSPIISDPDVHFQVDTARLFETLRLMRTLFEQIRPITRTVRKEAVGLLLRDQVLYAPLKSLGRVALRSPNGDYWVLVIDVTGTLSWVLTEPVQEVVQDVDGEEVVDVDGEEVVATLVEDETTVTQLDPVRGGSYLWTISNSGQFEAVPVDMENYPGGDVVVFIKDQSGVGSYVRVINGLLIPSKELSADSIHTDGTQDEVHLRRLYSKHVENPLDGVSPFMSDDATSNDSPGDGFRFQDRPEDEVSIRPLMMDFDQFHVDAHFGTEEEVGFSQSNWYYDTDGQLIHPDIRLRSAGIEPGVIEAVPTGDELLQNGLSYGYPVHFLTYANVYAYRDRITNAPMAARYTYDSPDQFTGGTVVIEPLEGDGPQEGSSTAYGEVGIPDVGDGVTPNGQFPTNPINSLVLDSLTRLVEKCWRFIRTDDDSGYLRLHLSQATAIQVGHLVYVASGPASGFHRVIAIGDLSITVDLLASGIDSSAGSLFCKVLETAVAAATEATLTFTREDNSSALDYVVAQRSGGTITILQTGSVEAGLFEGSVTVATTPNTELVVLTSSEFEALIVASLPDNFPDLDGVLMAQGGTRVAVEITLSEDSDSFYQSNEAGIDPHTPINGFRWWRGGTWRGSGSYVLTPRDGLPGILEEVP